MGRARIDLHRRKLDNVLSCADDEAFLVLCWACDTLQSGRPDAMRRYLSFPREANTTELSSPYFVHKWKMETLINELLASPKDRIDPRKHRTLDCRNFAAMAKLSNALRDLENSHDGDALTRVNIMQEIHRLTQRQFEWQAGFLNRPQYYRSAFIYGGPQTKAAFEDKYGLSIDEFFLGGFGLRGALLDYPAIGRPIDMSQIGVRKTTLDAILARVSTPHSNARAIAAQLRTGPGHISYKKSLLRQFPMISFGNGARIYCPLPDLLTVRTTSGIFYDVVNLGDEVRNEIAARFHAYCLEFMTIAFADASVENEWQYYPIGRKAVDTPDIIVGTDAGISLVVECKATRMSYEARFAEDPIASAERGYAEIAKGVFQIWRFVSRVRRGLVPGRRLAPDANGIVLTLDTWLSTAHLMQREVLLRARAIADAKDPEITEGDRIHVRFVSCSDLEHTYQYACNGSLMASIKAATDDRFEGYLLSSVHRELFPNNTFENDYPFGERIGEVLPWWDDPRTG